jgi:hypothetical protein
MKTIIKRSPEATFFVSGIVLSAISFWAQARWLHIANDWLGLGVGYDTRPLWFVIVMNVVAWLPWVAAALVIALRVTTGKQFKAVAFTLGVLSPLAMTIGFIFLQLPIHSLLNQKTFDSSAWIAQERKDPKWPARLTMVDDLVKRKLLDGKSKEEILAMLGPGGSS